MSILTTATATLSLPRKAAHRLTSRGRNPNTVSNINTALNYPIACKKLTTPEFECNIHIERGIDTLTIDSFDIELASDTSNSILNIPEGQRREMDRYLYNSLRNNYSAYYSIPTLASFVSTTSQSDLGKFSSAYDTLAILTDTTGALPTSTLFNNRIQAFKTANTQISAPSNAALYEKYINSIASTYLADTLLELTDSNIIELKYIASLCPAIYGNAVYDAASLVALIDKEYEFDESTNCIGSVFRLEEEETNIISFENAGFKIFPNPSADEITIKYLFKNDSEYWIRISDIVGREMFSTSNVSKVNISRLIDGTYFVDLYENGASVGIEKLVIIK